MLNLIGRLERGKGPYTATEVCISFVFKEIIAKSYHFKGPMVFDGWTPASEICYSVTPN